MLIRITEMCHMGCSHCMVSAHGLGRHMTKKTYLAALKFARIDNLALITGGEPTEHPLCCKFISEAQVWPEQESGAPTSRSAR